MNFLSFRPLFTHGDNYLGYIHTNHLAERSPRVGFAAKPQKLRPANRTLTTCILELEAYQDIIDGSP